MWEQHNLEMHTCNHVVCGLGVCASRSSQNVDLMLCESLLFLNAKFFVPPALLNSLALQHV
jgi:hypothetical protein